MILIRKPWTRQPVTPVRAIADGLVHAWSPNVGGGREILDMAGSAHGTFGVGDAGTSGNQWVTRPFSQAVKFDNTGTGQLGSITLRVGNSSGSGSPGSQRFSVQARVNLPYMDSYQSVYSGGTGGIEFRVDTGGALTLNVDYTAAVGTSTGTIAAGVDADIGMSYNGATVSFYINGVFAGSASASQTFALGQQHAIGDSATLTGIDDYLRAGSIVYYCYVWNRPRSEAEFRAVSDNPWRVFAPRQIIIPIAAGYTGPALTAAGAINIASTYVTPRVTVTF